MKIEGCMILTNKKMTDDLPQIGEKTLEASLRELEYRGLIEKSIVKVPQWRNARVRGIKITSAGMEYNSSLYSPSHLSIMNALQERITELENEKKEAQEEEPELKEEIEAKEEVKVKTEGLERQSEPSETTKIEHKAVVSQTKEVSKSQTLESFVKKTRNKFIVTSAPLCNKVEGWQKDTTFYINSYGRLSSTATGMDCDQIKNPRQINEFWTWLFKNQERVGEIVDFDIEKKKIAQLNKKYKEKKIKINGITRWIAEIVSINEGVAIKVKNERGAVAMMLNTSKKPLVYSHKELETFMKKISKR